MSNFIEEKIGGYTIIPAPIPSNPQAVGIRLPNGEMFGHSPAQVIVDRVNVNGDIVASHTDPGRPCKAFNLDNARDVVRQLIQSDENQAAKAKAKALAAAAIDAANAPAPAPPAPKAEAKGGK